MSETITILAAWGAVVSTISIAWNIYASVQDRGKIRVDAMFGTRIPDKMDERGLYIILTNVGKRSVLAKQIGAYEKTSIFSKRQCSIFLPYKLPMMLKEGEQTIEGPIDIKIISKRLKVLCAWDSIGNMYKLPTKGIRELLKSKEEWLSLQSRGSDSPSNPPTAPPPPHERLP